MGTRSLNLNLGSYRRLFANFSGPDRPNYLPFSALGLGPVARFAGSLKVAAVDGTKLLHQVGSMKL